MAHRPIVVQPEGDRRSLAFQAETGTERRLWSVFFVSRELGALAAMGAVAVLPDFGPNRGLLAAAGFLVIALDVWLHWDAQRTGRVSWLAVAQLAVPPLFILWEPRVWVPAVLGALAGVALFALAFRMPVPLIVLAGEGLLIVGAGLTADVDTLAEGVVAYVVVGPPLIMALNALFQAIMGSERQYRDFLEYANDIVYTHDLKTLAFLTVNESALRRTGYSREELGKLTVADVVAPEHLGMAAEMIQRKVEGETDATLYELEIVARDGRRIPVEVSTRLIERRGQPVAVQGIARDISERKHVEAQRVALDKARSEFIANAAHELRTPLTTLAGLASVLASTRDRMTEAEVDEAILALDRQGRRARMLADKLLDLSSVELGAIDVVREPVDVNETIERALEDAPPPNDTHVAVEVNADLKVLADPLRLQEIIQNLLTNAYRYGGPNVKVTGEAENGSVMLEVSDDGPGIPLDLRAHLFQPFARGDHGDGIGLGLAICARLAEAQEGDIIYAPDQSSGARFVVRLAAAT